MSEIPAGAKQPADKKSKKPVDPVEPDDVEAESETPEPIPFEWKGVTYLIDGDFADDLELVELLGDLDEDRERLNLVPKVMRSLMGQTGWDMWKRENRSPNGRLRLSDAVPFIEELFEELGLGN